MKIVYRSPSRTVHIYKVGCEENLRKRHHRLFIPLSNTWCLKVKWNAQCHHVAYIESLSFFSYIDAMLNMIRNTVACSCRFLVIFIRIISGSSELEIESGSLIIDFMEKKENYSQIIMLAKMDALTAWRILLICLASSLSLKLIGCIG